MEREPVNIINNFHSFIFQNIKKIKVFFQIQFLHTFRNIVIREIAVKVEPQLVIPGAPVFHVRCIVLIIKSHHLLYKSGRVLPKWRARRVLEKLVLKKRDQVVAVSNVYTLFLGRRIKPSRIQKGNLSGVAGKNVAHVARVTTRRVAARQTLATRFRPQSVHFERLFVIVINKRKIIIRHVATSGTVTRTFYRRLHHFR